MTEPSTTRREAADPFGEWASSKDVLMSYRYLASAPRPIDRTHAENLLRIRRDLRTPGGAMLAAPLAIAMLDAAGVNVDPVNILALTQVNITDHRSRQGHRRCVRGGTCRHRGPVTDLHRSVVLRRGRPGEARRPGLGELVGHLPDAGRFRLSRTGRAESTKRQDCRPCGRPTPDAGVPTVCSRYPDCGPRSAPIASITGRCWSSPRPPRSKRAPRRSAPTRCAWTRSPRRSWRRAG